MNSVAERRAPLLVLGVGNILRQDDGFADAVLQRLEREVLPEWVELFDAGTSAIDLMDIFDGRARLIVLDAVRGGQPAGTLYRFSPGEVEAGALPMNSLHQVGLLETLKLAELVDCKPQSTVVIGVQPAATGLGVGLSAPVREAVERAAALVIREIEDAAARIRDLSGAENSAARDFDLFQGEKTSCQSRDASF